MGSMRVALDPVVYPRSIARIIAARNGLSHG